MSENNNVVGVVLCETTAEKVEFKIKSEDKMGYIIAEGILQEADEVNRNRRFYPRDELARSVMSPRVQELVTSGNLKGEAGHPTDTSIARQSKVDPTLEQVWYLGLWMDGNYVKGRFTGTSNELGRSFNEDLRRGQKPSFSLRAVGSLVNENGRLTVRKMQMITYDRVYFPSHKAAYTSHIVTSESNSMQESASPLVINTSLSDNQINFIQESGNILETNNDLLSPLTADEVASYLVAESTLVEQALNTFDIIYESVTVDPLMQSAVMQTKYGDKIKIHLEDYIQKELITGINKIYK